MRPHQSFWLIAVLFCGLILRMLFLGRAELWQDELIFIRMAHVSSTPVDIFRSSWDFILSIGQLPLAFMVFNAFFHVLHWLGIEAGPDTPFWARMPAVLWGTGSIFTIYLLVERLCDRTSALAASAWIAFFFFPIYYSREAYVYAQILCLGPLAMYFYIRLVFDSYRSKWTYLGLFLALTGLLYAHMGALMLAVAIALCTGTWWVYLACTRRDPVRCRSLFYAGLAVALSLVVTAPHLLRFLLLNEAHKTGSEYSLFIILNDLIGKLFLGERFWAAVSAWTCFLLGVLGLVLPAERCAERRLFISITIIAGLLIAFATQQSQYLSVRYFSPVAPMIYLAFIAGFRLVSDLWALRFSQSYGRFLFPLLVGVPLLIHMTVYVPALLRLSYKSVPFGLIAEWINHNLPDGAPYVVESAYELRYVGGAFPTPDRFPVAPYVHLAGPAELQRLHEAQRDFMERFPESAFIQSAHHNWNDPEGLWTWPHDYFERHYRIQATDPLRRLIQLGVNPGLPHEELGDVSYRIDIYYRTWEDRVATARDRDEPVLFTFPGWGIQGQRQSPQQTFYFRVQPGVRGTFFLHQVGDASLEGGRIKLHGVMAGPSGRAARLTLQAPSIQQHPTPLTHRSGEPFVHEFTMGPLSTGKHAIHWQMDGLSGQDVGLIVLDVDWKASPLDHE